MRIHSVSSPMVYLHAWDKKDEWKKYVEVRKVNGIILNSVYIPDEISVAEGVYIDFGDNIIRCGAVIITYASCKTCSIQMEPTKFVELFSDWKTKPARDFGMEIQNLFSEHRNKEESYFRTVPFIK